MPNMPCSLSAWLRMWQWNAQIPGSVASTMISKRWPGAMLSVSHIVGLRHQVAILREDRHRHAVQVHGWIIRPSFM